MKNNLLALLTVACLVAACSGKKDDVAPDTGNNNNGGNTTTVKTPKSATVSTYAGGTVGFADNVGLAAQFNDIEGIVIDGAGALYVADYNNNRVRKIVAQADAGSVTTLAGTGALGGADGDALTAATLSSPQTLAVATDGSIYVSENGYVNIRKVSGGNVSTFAGTGIAGFKDGNAADAQFNHVGGMCVDAAGNIYIADTNNNRIRKITAAGVVSTFAGSGTAGSTNDKGTAATFNQPYGIVIDKSGNLYVSEVNNHDIRKITADGTVSTYVGNGQTGLVNGTGTAARLNFPKGLAIDGDGTLYVADAGNNSIRRITTGGVTTTLAGIGISGAVDGDSDSAEFKSPNGVAVDAAGNVYVADNGNSKIRKITVVY
ncbi:NHL repeat-containing protein [Mucilaginibacter yixingensis]|uniref:NHL repeat-containing protein n=1 Tax=Mucilaginibacter yixingensis TaxID=1295612 RepID=A0A2T5JDK7_9SPHI|nr:NHL repeat-containing protein [Mucilaginibacter yixingensis]PTQ99843.1 NHL repeat-containing protein [Mucilaginibacter yixingensis]